MCLSANYININVCSSLIAELPSLPVWVVPVWVCFIFVPSYSLSLLGFRDLHTAAKRMLRGHLLTSACISLTFLSVLEDFVSYPPYLTFTPSFSLSIAIILQMYHHLFPGKCSKAKLSHLQITILLSIKWKKSLLLLLFIKVTSWCFVSCAAVQCCSFAVSFQGKLHVLSQSALNVGSELQRGCSLYHLFCSQNLCQGYENVSEVWKMSSWMTLWRHLSCFADDIVLLALFETVTSNMQPFFVRYYGNQPLQGLKVGFTNIYLILPLLFIYHLTGQIFF